MDLIPSDIRLIAIAVVVVALIVVVAREYARKRAETQREKIGSE